MLGGGLITAGDVLIAPTRRAFADLVEAPSARARVRIEAAHLGEAAGSIGAGLLGRPVGRRCKLRGAGADAAVASAPGHRQSESTTAPPLCRQAGHFAGANLAGVEFRRINGLPPYVFAIINELRDEARHAGRDVIDMGFGNPDIPSPDIAVEKLAEAARNPRNHRYSASRGIPKLRLAVANLYLRRFGVELDPDTEVVTTIGAKEGLSHLMWTLVGPGDTALVPTPSYPIHIYAPLFAGADVQQVRLGPDQDFFGNLIESWESTWPRPRVIVFSFPHNPTTECVDLALDAAPRRLRPGARRRPWCTTSPTRTPPSTGTSRPRSCRCRAPRTWRSSCTP